MKFHRTSHGYSCHTARLEFDGRSDLVHVSSGSLCMCGSSGLAYSTTHPQWPTSNSNITNYPFFLRPTHLHLLPSSLLFPSSCSYLSSRDDSLQRPPYLSSVPSDRTNDPSLSDVSTPVLLSIIITTSLYSVEIRGENAGNMLQRYVKPTSTAIDGTQTFMLDVWIGFHAILA